jgi:hypothetical protein
MNLFQWLTIPLLIAVASLDVINCCRRKSRQRLLRGMVCLLAAVLILHPQVASIIARSLGIGRGADLVVYAFMLTTTGVLLQFYGRQFTLRRDLVELARREALRDPVAGAGLKEITPVSCSANSLTSNRESLR